MHNQRRERAHQEGNGAPCSRAIARPRPKLGRRMALTHFAQPIFRSEQHEKVLLRADDHSRPANARIADRLGRRKAIVTHHVSADERARASQARLAMNGNRAFFKLRGKTEKLGENLHRRIVAIGINQVKMSYP